MDNENKFEVWSIIWTDLTVENAEEVKKFYQEVVSWKSTPEDMGGYFDYHMSTPESGKRVAGICHSRGPNKDLPPQWLVYMIVEDMDRSISRCIKLGGKVVAGPKELGPSRFCVIQDPAGAVAALFMPKSE